jgi:hypothetical protein
VDEAPKYRRVYFENFEQREGLAESVWPLGRRGDWKGELAKGEFRLCNASGDMGASFTSALRYSEGEAEGIDQSNARLTMTVRLDAPVAKNSAAGILFRKSKEAYFAFALTAGHSLMFLKAQGAHVKILSTWTLDGIADGAPVTLRVEGHSNELRLFVKEKLVDTVPDPGGKGDPGVFAMGRGCARFDEMSVSLPH